MKKLVTLTLITLTVIRLSFAQTTPAPKLSYSKSFTWILLPDPQSYHKFARNQYIFTGMIDWIKDQKKNLNIQMVFCTGDLVEQNYILKPDSINGDQISAVQWKSVSDAFNKLNGFLPYVLCTGNHDYGIKSSENRYSQFNSFFPPQSNPLNYGMLVEMALNGQGVKTLENAAYEWTSPFGQQFLIFSFEFAPRNAVLAWAKEVAARPKYKNYIGVMLTHSYLNHKNERIVTEPAYPITHIDANYGEAMFTKFIQPSNNMQIIMSGHIGASDAHKDQVGFRTDKNAAGKTINQMVFNAQREGGGWHGNGGDGWLRILEFMPDKRIVKVFTFSPFFFISPSTRNLSWRKEAFDEYEFTY